MVPHQLYLTQNLHLLDHARPQDQIGDATRGTAFCVHHVQGTPQEAVAAQPHDKGTHPPLSQVIRSPSPSIYFRVAFCVRLNEATPTPRFNGLSKRMTSHSSGVINCLERTRTGSRRETGINVDSYESQYFRGSGATEPASKTLLKVVLLNLHPMCAQKVV